MREPPGDRELVVAFQRGDADAFAAIDQRYRPVARRVCERILIDPRDAEDAVQETMLAVYRALPRFNGQYLLGAYVSRIATSRSLDIIRKRRRRPALPLTESLIEAIEGAETLDDPADRVISLDDARAVGSVLRELPEHHATALRLRAFDDASHEQIASALETTPPRVKALLHRARASFRDVWLTKIGVVLAAFGGTMRRAGRLQQSPNTPGAEAGVSQQVASSAVAPMTGATQQLAASVTTLATNAAPMVTHVAASAEPVATAATKVASVAAAAALALGTGAGAVISRSDAPQTLVAPDATPTVIESSPPANEQQVVEPSPATSEPPPAQPAPSTEPTSQPSPASSSQPPAADPTPSGSSPEPSPSRSEEPKPTPTRAEPDPGFTAIFVSTMSSETRCGCSADSVLRSHDTSGSPRGTLTSTWRLDGGIAEATGAAAWRHASTLDFTATGGSGSATLGSAVTDGDRSNRYDLSLSLVSRHEGRDGFTVLTYEGRYANTQGPMLAGTVRIVLAVTPEGAPAQLSARFVEDEGGSSPSASPSAPESATPSAPHSP